MSRQHITRAFQSADLRELARVALAQGWQLTCRPGGHVKWLSPAGAVVFTPASPGGNRSNTNSKSQLRRAGLVV
jgi:hypothetical protein